MKNDRISSLVDPPIVGELEPTEPKYSSFEEFLNQQTVELENQFSLELEYRKSYIWDTNYRHLYEKLSDHNNLAKVVPSNELSVWALTRDICRESESARRLYGLYQTLNIEPNKGFFVRRSKDLNTGGTVNVKFPRKDLTDIQGDCNDPILQKKIDVRVIIPKNFDKKDLFTHWVVGQSLSDNFSRGGEEVFSTLIHEFQHAVTDRSFSRAFGTKMMIWHHTPNISFLTECLSCMTDEEYGLDFGIFKFYRPEENQSWSNFSPVFEHMLEEEYFGIKKLSIENTFNVETKLRVLSELGVPTYEIPGLIFKHFADSSVRPSKITLESVSSLLAELISQRLLFAGVQIPDNFQIENSDFSKVIDWLNKKYFLREIERRNAFFKALKPRFDLLTE